MRVVEETPPGAQVISFVLTGDGRTERKVLSAIAERYNGHAKILVFPKSTKPKKTGLSVFEAIESIHKLTGHTRYLILVDREHFSEEKLHKMLPTLFGKYKVTTVEPYTILTEKFEIYLVVLGEKTAVEDHIAKLINLEVGDDTIQIEYTDIVSLKRQIRTFIKTSGYKTLKKFILSCKVENIEAAFEPLVKVLKMLELVRET